MDRLEIDRRGTPRQIAIVAYPGVQSLDVTGPLEVFAGARLETARRLLEETSEPIAAIAARCGFGTPETMRRVFLRAFEVGPAEYRRRFHAPAAHPSAV